MKIKNPSRVCRPHTATMLSIQDFLVDAFFRVTWTLQNLENSLDFFIFTTKIFFQQNCIKHSLKFLSKKVKRGGGLVQKALTREDVSSDFLNIELGNLEDSLFESSCNPSSSVVWNFLNSREQVVHWFRRLFSCLWKWYSN